ncbi:hypothetical protein ACSQ67_025419 [Phaseolus vulgaris]
MFVFSAPYPYSPTNLPQLNRAFQIDEAFDFPPTPIGYNTPSRMPIAFSTPQQLLTSTVMISTPITSSRVSEVVLPSCAPSCSNGFFFDSLTNSGYITSFTTFKLLRCSRIENVSSPRAPPVFLPSQFSSHARTHDPVEKNQAPTRKAHSHTRPHHFFWATFLPRPKPSMYMF